MFLYIVRKKLPIVKGMLFLDIITDFYNGFYVGINIKTKVLI